MIDLQNPIKLDLQEFIADSVRCNEFFSLEDLPLNQSLYAQSLANIFCSISNNNPSEWREKISSSEEKDIVDLKNELELCEKLSDNFCKNIILLIQNNAEALLCSQDKKGRIFFLPEMKPFIAVPDMEPSQGGIGECYCSPHLERKERNAFSHELIDQIAKIFPEKKSIKIASIGAGACFHELEIHALAQKKGIFISEWTLVDPTLCEIAASHFETLAKWANPETKVATVFKEAGPYFINLRNNPSKPDVFLFIDVVDIKESKVKRVTKGLDHLYLTAYLSHKQRSMTVHKPSKSAKKSKSHPV